MVKYERYFINWFKIKKGRICKSEVLILQRDNMKQYASKIRVIYADTDAMGIVYHMNYIKWFEIGRNEYLRQIGYPYSRLEKEGIWLPVLGVTCEYKRPAKYDDVLLIKAGISELKNATVSIA